MKNCRKVKSLVEYSEVQNVKDTAFKDGELSKALKIAKEMLLDNEPIDKIVRYTQLSIEQINLLK